MENIVSIRDHIVTLLGEYQPSLGPNGEVLGGLYSLDFTWLVGAFCFCAGIVGLFAIGRTVVKALLG